MPSLFSHGSLFRICSSTLSFNLKIIYPISRVHYQNHNSLLFFNDYGPLINSAGIKTAIIKDKKYVKPKTILSVSELNKVIVYKEFEEGLKCIEDDFKEFLTNSLTTRRGIGIENLSVVLEGEKLMIKELAVITTKPDLIILDCNEFPEAAKVIYEALLNADMNLAPQQEGKKIYVKLPRITKEYRINLVKNAKSALTKVRESINRHQSKFLKIAKDTKSNGISEDLIYDACENIKYISSQCFNKCEEMFKAKEEKLLGE